MKQYPAASAGGCAARNEAHLRGGVVDAVEIDGLNKIAIAANQICSIVRHCAMFDRDGGLIPGSIG